ncbi:MAG: hypothetical protein LHW56_01670 [Candidatus Cloacimonetes bacterium]|nr:hypothetical protein [Candidatus Cloacimonadota bacterium]MDY0171596.1 hypothetical protein [Candidatus Cloacimonadaceae bacterium]
MQEAYPTLGKCRGHIHIDAYDRQDFLVHSWDFENLIVQGACRISAQTLSGNTDYRISRVALGNDSAAPTTNDTNIGGIFTEALVLGANTVGEDMVAWVASITGVPEFPDAATMRVSWNVGYDEANGLSVCELGLLSENNVLFSRKTRSMVVKDASIRLAGTWSITFV